MTSDKYALVLSCVSNLSHPLLHRLHPNRQDPIQHFIVSFRKSVTPYMENPNEVFADRLQRSIRPIRSMRKFSLKAISVEIL